MVGEQESASASPSIAASLHHSDTAPTVTAGELRQWRQSAIAQASSVGGSGEDCSETGGEAFDKTDTGAESESESEAEIEIDWLLRELAQVERLKLRHAAPEDLLTLACSLSQLNDIWQRRLRERSPLQYLVGHAPWRNLELRVGPGVLIPRPETELLIDLVEQQIREHSPEQQTQLKQGVWADLGTGTGAIALGLASKFATMQIHAVDCSAEALAIAQANVRAYSETYNLKNRLSLHLGDWLEPLQSLRGQLQGIVSNPPYIPSETITTLQPEVQHHEPHLALDGGADGLDCLRHLVRMGAQFLAPGGFWAVELMAGQASAVEALLQAEGSYDRTGRQKDLSGIERFVWAYRR